MIEPHPEMLRAEIIPSRFFYRRPSSTWMPEEEAARRAAQGFLEVSWLEAVEQVSLQGERSGLYNLYEKSACVRETLSDAILKRISPVLPQKLVDFLDCLDALVLPRNRIDYATIEVLPDGVEGVRRCRLGESKGVSRQAALSAVQSYTTRKLEELGKEKGYEGVSDFMETVPLRPTKPMAMVRRKLWPEGTPRQ